MRIGRLLMSGLGRVVLSMTRFVAVPIVTVGTVSAAVASGDASFVVNGATFGLGTGTGHGLCLVTQHTGYAEIQCADGNDWAIGNTRDGCTGIHNNGACGAGLYQAMGTGDIDITCKNGNTMTINTNNKGSGAPTTFNGNVTGGKTDDGAGNSASADCSLNGGKGACSGITGTGSCTCKAPCVT